jgi:hypothetical protein
MPKYQRDEHGNPVVVEDDGPLREATTVELATFYFWKRESAAVSTDSPSSTDVATR